MKQANIIHRLLENAGEYPDHIALIEPRVSRGGKRRYRQITYRQLLADVIKTADNFRSRGLHAGDRVIVFVPMSYAVYVTVIALLYIGAVALFIDAWADRARFRSACRLAAPRGFIGSWKAQFLQVVPEIRRLPVKMVSSRAVSISAPAFPLDPVPAPASVNRDDEALITLTTGSTGKPKGVKRTHGEIGEQYLALKDHLMFSESDVDLTALPIFILNNMAIGITSVLPIFDPAAPADFDPAQIIAQIRECGVTTSTGSPAFYNRVADHLIAQRSSLPLKKIFTGGAPVFHGVAEKLMRAFPATAIEVIYGCTEAEPISGILLPELLKFAPGSGIPAGKPVRGIRLCIIKPHDGPLTIKNAREWKSIQQKKGEVGEIIIAGAHVLQEYLGGPELREENKIIHEGTVWHRTGDAGRMDARGFLFLFGRIGQRFTDRAGNTLYPIPLEQRLLEIQGIAFAALIPCNELIYAFIEPSPGLEHGQIQELLVASRRALPELNPAHIIAQDKIPRDPRHHSKVNAEKLRAFIKDI